MNTNKEIEEGNKIIAEFMGFKVLETSVDGEYRVMLGNGIIHKRFRPLEKPSNPNEYFINLFCNLQNTGHAKYHTSWDWLMPVISSFELKTECQFDWDEAYENETISITKAWAIMVQAIKQFNNQKQPQ